MNDDWEAFYFGGLSRDGSGDHDGDGQTDRAEYASGTDPTDPRSLLRVISFEPVGDGLFGLTWSSVPGRRYTVQYSADLTSWVDLATVIEATSATTSTLAYPAGSTLETVLLFGEDAPARVLVPTSDIGTAWRGGDEIAFALAGGDGAWLSGTMGVGYERDDGGPFLPFLNRDIEAPMFDTGTSALVRVPFEVDEPAAVMALDLGLRYDDGFVAFLNGVQVAARNAPASVDGNSAALEPRPDEDAVAFERIDLSAFSDQLRPGANILAIHGLNQARDSSDFLIQAELSAGRVAAAPAAAGFWRVAIDPRD